MRKLLGLGAALALLVVGLPAQVAQAAEFEVLLENFAFIPDTQYVNEGDTVTWVWGEDPAPHNVTGIPADESPIGSSGDRGPGPAEPYSVDFPEEGTYPYICTIHSSPDGTEPGDMAGEIIVLPAGVTPPAEPRPAPEPGALPQAADNVDAALAWSSLFADDGAPDVLLGREDNFADSLTSGGLQGLLDAPLLLTATGELDERVEAELARLGAERVWIMGGTNAVSQAVEDALVDLGYEVTRIQGTTRLETAAAAAEALIGEEGTDPTTAIVARAYEAEGSTDPTQAFADSLAAGGAAAREAIPILLSETGFLSATTTAFFEAHPEITTVYVVGGIAALSQQVEDDLIALGLEVVRLAGATRFDTASAIAREFYPFPEVFLLIEGQADSSWAGGFTAASAAESAPIVLSNGDTLPQTTLEGLSFGVPALCGPQTSPVACATAEQVAGSGQFGDPDALVAFLEGDEEVAMTRGEGPGADDGRSGDAFIFQGGADDAVCFELSAYQFPEPMTAAHIHAGADGVNGPIVVPLVVPEIAPIEDGGAGFIRSCALDQDPAVIADIFANPANYYVNYHTATFPAGAVRGQLFLPEAIFVADLLPENEIPGPGAEGAAGFAGIAIDSADHSTICHYMFSFTPDAPTAAHIHVGAPDVAGPILHPLELPNAVELPAEAGGGWAAEGSSCETAADPAHGDDVLADPGGHYVNVHTAAFPMGAIRGQLSDPTAPPPEGRASWAR